MEVSVAGRPAADGVAPGGRRRPRRGGRGGRRLQRRTEAKVADGAGDTETELEVTRNWAQGCVWKSQTDAPPSQICCGKFWKS